MIESSNSNTIVMVQESFDEDDEDVVLIICTTSSTDAWIFESGASFHMTYNLDWFDSFKKWNVIVQLGDDGMHCIKANGILQIKIHDDMVRKLDCWYVSDLLKYMISLGTLAMSELKYSDEDDWVKVSKCALEVITRKMKHMICFMEESFVRATVATYQSLDQCDDK